MPKAKAAGFGAVQTDPATTSSVKIAFVEIPTGTEIIRVFEAAGGFIKDIRKIDLEDNPNTPNPKYYTEYSLQSGATIYWKCEAVGSMGTVLGTCNVTASAICLKPYEFSADNVTLNDLRVNWKRWGTSAGTYIKYQYLSDRDPYQVVRNRNLDGDSLNLPNVQSYTFSGVYPGTQIYTQVAYVNNNGLKAWSDEFTTCTKQWAPSGLSMYSASPNSITLKWDLITKYPDTAPFTYRVYKNGTAYASISSDTATCTVTDLAPSTSYSFRVDSSNAAGSTTGTAVSLTTPNVGVSTISTITANSPRSSKIAWNNPGNVNGYKIYRNLNGGSYSYLATISGADTLTYDDNTIVPSTQSANNTYGYKISGVYDTYESGQSAEKTFVAPVIGVPTVNISNVTPKSLKLDWGTVTNAFYYNVYRKRTGESTFTKIQERTSNLFFNDSNLDASTQSASVVYDYYVTGVDSNNSESQNSAIKSQTMPTVGVPTLSTPASSDITTSSVKLTWSNPGNVSFYKVFRGTSAGSYDTTPIFTSSNASTTTYTNTGLSTATKYYYKVVGVYTYNSTDYEGQTTSDNTKEVTTKSTAPTGLTVGARTSSSIALSWTAPGSAVAGYNIYRKPSGGSYEKVNFALVTDTSRIDVSLNANTQYTYNG